MSEWWFISRAQEPIHAHANETRVKGRERAFALAGCRSANTGRAQHVWNPETGERWSVRFGDVSGDTRRLKDRAR